MTNRAGSPFVALVVAMADEGVIGRDNALPWRLPGDLQWFKALTMGKPILMGRRTFESIGRPLPGRTNLVMTRDSAWRADGVTAVHSVDEALAHLPGEAQLMVIGGAEIYRQFLPLASRIYLTRVHAQVEGDTKFPQFDSQNWREVERAEHAADERHAHAMTFITLERAPEKIAAGDFFQLTQR